MNAYHDIHTTHRHVARERNYLRDIAGPYIHPIKQTRIADWNFRERRHRCGGIIGFSLFGTEERYIAGAIANARAFQLFYPDWVMRVYVDSAIRDDVRDELTRNGVDIVELENNPAGIGYFWRFFVADEPGFIRWGVRDIDSRLSIRERIAVEEWIRSGYKLHTSRDHPHHTNPIMACFVNGVRLAFPGSITDAIREWASCHDLKYGADEVFLKEVVLPKCNDSLLVHSDATSGPGIVRPFPINAEGYQFIGARTLPTGELLHDDRDRFAMWIMSMRQDN